MHPLGTKVLVVTGRGSTIRNGILAKVKCALSDFQLTELSGVDPNPRVTTVRKGVELCREKVLKLFLQSVEAALSIAPKLLPPEFITTVIPGTWFLTPPRGV